MVKKRFVYLLFIDQFVYASTTLFSLMFLCGHLFPFVYGAPSVQGFPGLLLLIAFSLGQAIASPYLGSLWSYRNSSKVWAWIVLINSICYFMTPISLWLGVICIIIIRCISGACAMITPLSLASIIKELPEKERHKKIPLLLGLIALAWLCSYAGLSLSLAKNYFYVWHVVLWIAYAIGLSIYAVYAFRTPNSIQRRGLLLNPYSMLTKDHRIFYMIFFLWYLAFHIVARWIIPLGIENHHFNSSTIYALLAAPLVWVITSFFSFTLEKLASWQLLLWSLLLCSLLYFLLVFSSPVLYIVSYLAATICVTVCCSHYLILFCHITQDEHLGIAFSWLQSLQAFIHVLNPILAFSLQRSSFALFQACSFCMLTAYAIFLTYLIRRKHQTLLF